MLNFEKTSKECQKIANMPQSAQHLIIAFDSEFPKMNGFPQSWDRFKFLHSLFFNFECLAADKQKKGVLFCFFFIFFQNF